MPPMDELNENEIQQNKAIRGYIIRSLVKGNQNSLLLRQITNSLIADGMILSPDIGKHLDYLKEGEYITYPDKTVNSYTAYRKDSVIKLTKKGVDLVEGTIEDPGVDV